MKTQKKIFLTPEIIIIPIDAADVICASGNDAVDNWKSDIFI